MRIKWVDIANYIGPDRRKKRSARWSDRREDDLAGDQPPLGTLLRRMRVHVLRLEIGEDRGNALSLIAAGIAQAEAHGYAKCAAALKQAEQILRADAPPEDAAKLIDDATDHATAER
jgi:hypothetical protein